MLVLYYRDYLKLKAKERKIKLIEFCQKNIPNYDRALHFKIVNRALQKASNKKQKLIKIEKIDIYKDEMDYINSLDIDYDYKKLIFTFLVQMRLNKNVSELKNGKEYISTYFKGGKKKYQNIKSMAKINNKININDDFINYVSKLKEPLITPLYSGLIELNFLDNCNQTGDIVIKIKDYENVGWYFDYYNHIDGIKLCDYCNQPFKQRKKNSRLCNKHLEYQPIEKKIIQCIDCGCDVEVDSKDNQTNRCNKCYKNYRREYYKLKKREQRSI